MKTDQWARDDRSVRFPAPGRGFLATRRHLHPRESDCQRSIRRGLDKSVVINPNSGSLRSPCSNKDPNKESIPFDLASGLTRMAPQWGLEFSQNTLNFMDCVFWSNKKQRSRQRGMDEIHREPRHSPTTLKPADYLSDE